MRLKVIWLSGGVFTNMARAATINSFLMFDYCAEHGAGALPMASAAEPGRVFGLIRICFPVIPGV